MLNLQELYSMSADERLVLAKKSLDSAHGAESLSELKAAVTHALSIWVADLQVVNDQYLPHDKP